MENKTSQAPAPDPFGWRLVVTTFAFILLIWHWADPLAMIDLPTLVLIAVAVLPWVRLERLFPPSASGDVDLRANAGLQRDINRLRDEVETLKLLTLSLPSWERQLLKRFANETDKIVQDVNPNFRKDIAGLRGRGYIEQSRGEELPEAPAVVVKDYYRITPLGLEFLQMLKDLERKFSARTQLH